MPNVSVLLKMGISNTETFTNNITNTGSVQDTPVEITFNHEVLRLDIWNGSDVLYVARDSGDGTYQDEIKLEPNQFYSFDGKTKAIKIRSTSNGTEYQIVGWW